jgi:hypothetical protein
MTTAKIRKRKPPVKAKASKESNHGGVEFVKLVERRKR